MNIHGIVENEIQNSLFNYVIGRNDNRHPLRLLEERNELELNNNNNINNRRRHENNTSLQVEQLPLVQHDISIQNLNNNPSRRGIGRIAIHTVVPNNGAHNHVNNLFQFGFDDNTNEFFSSLEDVPRGISQMEIEQRTHSFIIKERKILSEENKTCAICQNDFENGDKVRQLSLICSHIFHKECIDRWMTEQQPTCPICRKNIMDTDM